MNEPQRFNACALLDTDGEPYPAMDRQQDGDWVRYSAFAIVEREAADWRRELEAYKDTESDRIATLQRELEQRTATCAIYAEQRDTYAARLANAQSCQSAILRIRVALGLRRDSTDDLLDVIAALHRELAEAKATIAEREDGLRLQYETLLETERELAEARLTIQDREHELVQLNNDHALLKSCEVVMRAALTEIAEYTGEGPHTTPWQAIVKSLSDKARAALASQAAPKSGEHKRVAPWPDFNGKPIHEGDTIRHPDGSVGTVVFLNIDHPTDDPWRIQYEDGITLRLNLQIGDKGRGVVSAKLNDAPKSGEPHEG